MTTPEERRLRKAHNKAALINELTRECIAGAKLFHEIAIRHGLTIPAGDWLPNYNTRYNSQFYEPPHERYVRTFVRALRPQWCRIEYHFGIAGQFVGAFCTEIECPEDSPC